MDRLRDQYWKIDSLEPDPIVRISRTASCFDSMNTLHSVFRSLALELDRLGGPSCALLADLRSGPTGRNDPAFELAMAEYRPRLFEHFCAGATVVTTASGVLQLSRTAREDGDAYQVFTSMEAALDYLMAEIQAGREGP